MFLDKSPDDGLDFLEAALLAAYGEHLESKDTGSGFSLHPLSNREGVLSEALAVLEVAPHQSAHSAQHCEESEKEWLVSLFGRAAIGFKFRVDLPRISDLE